MTRFLDRCLREALHLIYPHVCICCHTLLEESENYVCKTCYEQLDKFLLPGESATEISARLAKHFPFQTSIKEGLALYRFHKSGLLQEIIHSIKYGGLQNLAVELGMMLGKHILSEKPFSTWEAIIPVPLHHVKHIERGYNQAEALANGVSRAIGIPVVRNAVMRSRYTESQTKLAAEKRRANISGVFQIRQPVQFKQILLIDDVFTTGATLVELSHELKKYGAIEITIAALAVTST
ncbi:competence protein [Chloroherpeton thalassium ATCC 35110]|uniref:Competence protein n=1 Tax=Chloroherpeton thalassium (strain ATCC 35110 / GB-78) TaxID=517418 RepID=B3QV62_CHLT3|nr:ComF family protein [Chloroherpeton thalassium]ACF13016.1 competence protein [Chloroherpeton thalassium ATCC 35110]